MGWLYSAIETIREWQTLVSAALAMSAAAWTIRTMKSQMNQENLRHKNAEIRKKLAVRAQLPNALSSMTRHIRAQVDRLQNDEFTPVDPPVGAISTLQNAIEFVDDRAAGRLFELVSWYQVWDSRIRSSDGFDFDTAIYDSVLLAAYTDSMYEYARNETDEVPNGLPTQLEMKSALRTSVGLPRFLQNEDRFSAVVSRIEKRHCGTEE